MNKLLCCLLLITALSGCEEYEEPTYIKGREYKWTVTSNVNLDKLTVVFPNNGGYSTTVPDGPTGNLFSYTGFFGDLRGKEVTIKYSPGDVSSIGTTKMEIEAIGYLDAPVQPITLTPTVIDGQFVWTFTLQ